MTAEARQLARERRAWALPGSRWDKVVKLLRRVFPLAALGIALTALIWPLTEQREFSFILSKDEVEMAGDRMRLGEAVYRGEDSSGRPFIIRALSGVQQTSADPRVVLVGLGAQMRMEEGDATVEAPRGIYDQRAERLLVDGPVKVRRTDGYRLVTSDVAVDIPSRTLVGEGRIAGALPLGTFAGDRLQVDVEERVLILEGNTRMRLTP